MDEEEEAKFLESSLKTLGLFEDGMDLQEMRSIRDVVNESLEESSLAFEDELQAALLESQQMANENLHRSYETSSFENSNTVHGAMGRFSTPPSSPDCPRLLKVVAEVHSGWKETSLQDGGQASGEDIENKTESNIKPRMKDTLLKGRNVALKNADDIYSALDIDDAKL
ncbi:uncharacterized protein LOC119646215 isoform X2 [Hermetia illucens]|uniref:uncharacterized protein LOC119646215 isoform X2 n=1 Tax=Hermetia illucens TaxID=343691 RepID=UPI0018CBF38A|nr:uncharacterized protein LOC119646215 isoform X2 [Hermetia illucens]